MKRRKQAAFTLSNRRREAATGWFFVALFAIGFLVFYLPAIVQSIRFSFSETDADFNLMPAGLENYRYIFRVDPDFVRDMVEGLGSLLVDVMVIILYAMFICTLLNRSLRGKGVFRALLFLPVIVSTGCIEQFLNFSAQTGAGLAAGDAAAGGDVFQVEAITKYILSMSFSDQLTEVVGGAIQQIYGIITRSGVQTIIFLAGMQSISPSVYEAARVEGCSGWETYWKITVPLLSPLIAVNMIYTVIDSFTRSDNAIMSRILHYAMVDFNYGYSSAMAWSYFILVCVVLLAVVAVLNKFTFYETR